MFWGKVAFPLFIILFIFYLEEMSIVLASVRNMKWQGSKYILTTSPEKPLER